MFLNRELSWLEFNSRVLNEAASDSLPVLERLKFSGIFSSNLDEFFMVRVASINDLINQGYDKEDPSGLLPEEQFEKINERVKTLVNQQYIITNDILTELESKNHKIIKINEINEEDYKYLESKFDNEIFPVLTPMAVDISRPFPLLSNKGIYIGVLIEVDDLIKFALVPVPPVLKRVIKILGKKYEYILLESLIKLHIDKLFSGNKILSTTVFRVTRNADLNIIEEDANDLLMVIEESIKQRKWGDVIRIEIESDYDEQILHILKNAFELDDSQVHRINGIIDLTMLFDYTNIIGDKRLSLSKHRPRVLPFMKKKNIFKTISQGDIFIHHPYESFDYIVDFIKQASQDDNVLAIKQTLYRVSGDSPIIKALATAAERGIQVTVLVELMARFDEENNINWAKKLEKTGCHVIYGIFGLKTHSKITLVVRKEKTNIKRYVHLATGNYNDSTAKLYTDMGILTCKESYGSDASAFFNMISGYSDSFNMNRLIVAPYNLREEFYRLIDNEIEAAKLGKKAGIVVKINSLVDKELIERLYAASQAGVKIELIVRGICTLIPGVKGLSENIKVISIVGRFLEHTRIYKFKNLGDDKIFLSSADWMTRNLNRRIEILFPVEDDIIKNRISETLELYLMDNQKSWYLSSNGSYYKTKSQDKKINAQDILSNLSYDSNESFIKAIKSIKEK